jgi:hypothetical protein
MATFDCQSGAVATSMFEINICACHLLRSWVRFLVRPIPQSHREGDREGDSLWQRRFPPGSGFILHYITNRPILSRANNVLGDTHQLPWVVERWNIPVSISQLSILRRGNEIIFMVLAPWQPISRDKSITSYLLPSYPNSHISQANSRPYNRYLERHPRLCWGGVQWCVRYWHSWPTFVKGVR